MGATSVQNQQLNPYSNTEARAVGAAVKLGLIPGLNP